jgi:hypothetical protein
MSKLRDLGATTCTTRDNLNVLTATGSQAAYHSSEVNYQNIKGSDFKHGTKNTASRLSKIT